MPTGYIGLFRSAGLDGWRVTFPDLPGCEAIGDSFKEAVDAATEAVAEHLDDLPGPRPPARSALELMAAGQWDPVLKRQLAHAVLHSVPAPAEADELAPADLVAASGHGAPGGPSPAPHS